MSDEHQSFIKTPRQLITVVVLAFVVPILIIVLLVKYVGTNARTGAGADTMTPEAIEARIQSVAGFELRDAAGGGALRSGEQVYKAACTACHATGVAGAPKVGGMNMVGVIILLWQKQRQALAQTLQRQPISGINAWCAQNTDAAGKSPQLRFSIYPPYRPRRLCGQTMGFTHNLPVTIAIHAARADIHQAAW